MKPSLQPACMITIRFPLDDGADRLHSLFHLPTSFSKLEVNHTKFHLNKRYIVFITVSTICDEMVRNGWNVSCFAVEVDSRGYCSEIVKSCLTRLDIANKMVKSYITLISMASIKASFLI